ncbi:MAG: beta-eliminating lyase-related protein [Patescibacteria group bacterium]
MTISAIVRKSLKNADIVFMSAKKDGLANMGGFIATDNKKFAEKSLDIFQRHSCR